MIRFDDIQFATLSDVGVRRSHNQDAFAALPAGDAEQWQHRGHVFVVADGMGAHAVGELASKLAADNIPHIYAKHAHEGPMPALKKAFAESNLSIHTRGQQNREFEGMGTTAIAIVLRPEGVWIGHVGDSRAYRIRNGKIEQLSFDHSLVWELARRQRKNPEELQGIPSNVIVRSLGPEPLVQVDVEGPHPVQPGDSFLLCSDGLTGPVSDREIGSAISTLPPAEACRFLIALANLQGGPDNITAIVIQVADNREVEAAQKPGARGSSSTLAQFLKRFWMFIPLVLGVLAALGAIVLTHHELPGKVPTFVFASLALAIGIVGLLIQSFTEKKTPPEDVWVPRTKIYRQAACNVDPPFILRLSQALDDLESRIRERGWNANWGTCREFRQESERHLRSGELVDAFRANCRALLVLTDAIQQQRGKEEAFRPLWDKAPAKLG